ncbi:MAG: hypothetical protein ACTSRZ_05665 [Promethearchaeota archaeon]
MELNEQNIYYLRKYKDQISLLIDELDSFFSEISLSGFIGIINQAGFKKINNLIKLMQSIGLNKTFILLEKFASNLHNFYEGMQNKLETLSIYNHLVSWQILFKRQFNYLTADIGELAEISEEEIEKMVESQKIKETLNFTLIPFSISISNENAFIFCFNLDTLQQKQLQFQITQTTNDTNSSLEEEIEQIISNPEVVDLVVLPDQVDFLMDLKGAYSSKFFGRSVKPYYRNLIKLLNVESVIPTSKPFVYEKQNTKLIGINLRSTLNTKVIPGKEIDEYIPSIVRKLKQYNIGLQIKKQNLEISSIKPKTLSIYQKTVNEEEQNEKEQNEKEQNEEEENSELIYNNIELLWKNFAILYHFEPYIINETLDSRKQRITTIFFENEKTIYYPILRHFPGVPSIKVFKKIISEKIIIEPNLLCENLFAKDNLNEEDIKNVISFIDSAKFTDKSKGKYVFQHLFVLIHKIYVSNKNLSQKLVESLLDLMKNFLKNNKYLIKKHWFNYFYLIYLFNFLLENDILSKFASIKQDVASIEKLISDFKTRISSIKPEEKRISDLSPLIFDFYFGDNLSNKEFSDLIKTMKNKSKEICREIDDFKVFKTIHERFIHLALAFLLLLKGHKSSIFSIMIEKNAFLEKLFAIYCFIRHKNVNNSKRVKISKSHRDIIALNLIQTIELILNYL